MQFSIATIVLAFAALSTAAITDAEGLRFVERSALLDKRQNAGRPVAVGNCCIAATSVKQDTCTTTTGAAGRCVPGGPAACKSPFQPPRDANTNSLSTGNGALNCVAQTALTCDANVIERGQPLCRAKVAGGVQDGAKVVASLAQAKVN